MTDSSNPTAPHGAEPGPTPLRLALVGCGAISRMHRAGLAPLASRCQITAAVDPVLERAQEVGQENGARAFSDLDEALRFAAQEDGFDAVDLMLPHHLHEEMTTRCLRQGLHVLLEKPIAPTVEASRRILAEAEASEGRLMVAENAQYWPEVLRARDWIEAGRIGRVVTAQATVWIPPLRAYYGGDRPWRFQQNAAGGGITLDTGSHWLRALRVWLGDAEAVVGSLGHPVAEMEGESLAHALFRFPGGVVATFHALLHRGAMGPSPHFRITGTEGEILIDSRGPVTVFDSDHPRGERHELGGYLASYAAEMDDFVRAIADGVPFAASAEHALGELLMAHALYRSHSSGRWEEIS